MNDELTEPEEAYCLTEMGAAFAKWLGDRDGDFELMVDAFTAGWRAREEAGK